ncbi:MAG: transglycosylase SLT domain-containing protein [Kiloniellales bacterium]
MSRPAPAQAEFGLAAIAETLARKHGLQPELVHAVILAESRYNAGALSHKGAMGLMQLMPATASRYGVGDPWDPSDNIDGGVRYLRDLMKQFRDLDLVLAAYNAGEQAVARYGNQVPPFAETTVYVERVKAFYDRLNSGSSVTRLMTQGVPGSGDAVRLSGWGVIFGAFPDKAEARGMLRQQQGRLRSVMRRGNPAVVRRNREDGPRYAALLVGLKQEDAAAACRHLRGSGSYCKALTPGELKDPNALWR